MKKLILISIMIFVTGLMQYCVAQATLEVEISADTIGMEDAVKVSYKLKGARAQIDILDFENFHIAGGPNISSSMRMVNGTISQEYEQSYYLIPKDQGSVYVPSASVVIDDLVLETEPKEVFVMPVPNYQQKVIPQRNQRQYNTTPTPPRPPATPKDNEAEYQRLLKKRALAKKKKKF